MRKILNNFQKSKRMSGTQKGKIGTPLSLIDKNREPLFVGDELQYGQYHGILLYNPASEQYGIALDYSKWYGVNRYDIKTYGKFVPIPMDNGARMEIEKIV